MIINSIVAEFNPLHNGHIKLIEDSKKALNADATIVIMSGNFVQRGNPALLDQFSRTKLALECGADLVIQLPTLYSASSAEYFAKGAIGILDKLGVVTHLSFGSENGNLSLLSEIAGVLANEPESYKSGLKKNLKEGMTYPLARNRALIEYDPAFCDVATVLNAPNNILAIEYLKAIISINSKISPFTVRRQGAGYHDKFAHVASNTISSMAIREAIAYNPDSLLSMKDFLPEITLDSLSDAAKNNTFLNANDLSEMLLYKLIMEREEGFSSYLDVSPELSDRICKKINEFTTFDSFCDLIKSKDITYTRVSRVLLHILLGIRKTTMDKSAMIQHAPYARVLGFRKESEFVLSEIKQNSRIPLITKLADAEKMLFAEPLSIYKYDLRMNEIYYAAMSQKSGCPIINEISHPIVII